MKKITSIIMLLLVAILIAGCGDSNNSSKSSNSSSTATSAPAAASSSSSIFGEDLKKKYSSTEIIISEFNKNLEKAFAITGTDSWRSFAAPQFKGNWEWRGKTAMSKWQKSRNQDVSYRYGVYDMGAKLCGRDMIIRIPSTGMDPNQVWGIIIAQMMLVEKDKEKILEITQNLGIDTGIKPGRYYEYTDKSRNAKFWVNTDLKNADDLPLFEMEVGIHLRSNPFTKM